MPSRPHLRRSSLPAVLLVGLCMALAPGAVRAQSFQGSTLSTVGGIALGGYSGSVLGLVGSSLPCNRTLYGPRCAAAGSSVGAALGIAMGGLIGAQNQDLIVRRLEHAGVGSLVGAGVGVVLWRAVRQYELEDAATVAAIGGAFGAAPRGSAIGLGAGAAVGGLVWLVFPRAGLPDFLMFSVAGAALGGLVDWGRGAATVRDSRTALFVPSFSIPVR